MKERGTPAEATTKAVHNLPVRNPYFTGRVAVLEKIEKALAGKKGRAGIKQVEGISGLGGIGKTQTALEFAWQRLGKPYTHVFWVRADTQAELEGGFLEIARKLALPEKDAQDAAVAVQAVRAWFESHDDGTWLLVLDNVEHDGQEMVAGFVPRGGHVLVTSRADALDVLGIPNPTEISLMSVEEARDFFAQRVPEKAGVKDIASVDAVAKRLGWLPLALEQAAAYIIEMGCTFAEYLQSFEKCLRETLQFPPAAGREKLTPEAEAQLKTVYTTWRMNFDQVEKESKAARDLLYCCAFFDPDRIPLELIRNGASKLGPELAAALADADAMAPNKVLHPLVRYSLIRRDTKDDSFSIHRLIQEVIRAGMTEADQRDWAERAALAVNAAFPGDFEFKDWPMCDRLLPHARRAADFIERYGLQSVSMARLLNQTAMYLYKRAHHAEFVPLTRWAQDMAEAEPLYRRAQNMAEDVYKPDHPEVATVLNNLAMLLQDTNRLGEAEPLMRRALDMAEAAYSPNHPDVARDLNNLANLLQAMNRLAEAEPLMRRALDIDQAAYGPDHPNVAIHLNNLAQLLKNTNRLAEAEPLMRQVIEIWKKALGEDHPNVAMAFNNLALLLETTNRLEEAEPMYRRALAIDEAVYGSDHPDVATALNNLAEFLRVTNRLEEAEPMYRRALDIDEAACGPDHPNVARDLNNLAILLQNTNRLAEAEPMYRRALKIDEAAYGPDHPNVAIRLNNLAQLLQATKRLAEAEPLMRRALDMAETAYGPDHPKVAIRLNNLAQLLKATNRLAAAKPLMRRVVVILRKFKEATEYRHPHMNDAVLGYFGLLIKMGVPPEEVLQKVMEASGWSREEIMEALKG